MKRRSRKLIGTLFLLALPLLFGCAATQSLEEETMVIRIGSDMAEEGPGYRQLVDFGKQLTEASDGKIQVKIYPTEKWSDDDSLLDYLEIEAIEMVCISNSRAATKIPAYEIFDLPYLFADAGQVENYLQGAQGQQALALWDPFDYQAIGFVGNGYQYFLQSRGSSVVTGWSGLYMDVAQKPLWLQGLAAIGVTGIEADGNSIYYDARCCNEAETKKLMGQQVINEGTYVNDPDMFYNIEMLLCADNWWEKLTEEDQQLIKQCFAKALEKNMQTLQNTNIATVFAQGGITVDLVTAEQKQGLYQMTAAVRNQYFDSGASSLASQWRYVPPVDDAVTVGN